MFLAGIAAFKKNKKTNIKLFIFANISLSLWNVSDLLIATASQEHALFLDRISYLFALLVVPSYFLLLINASNPQKPFRIPRILIFIFFLFIPLLFTPLIISDVQISPTFNEVPGPLYVVFVAYFLIWILLGLFNVYKSFLHSDGLQRNQLKFIFLGILVGLIAAVQYFLCMFYDSIPPLYAYIEMTYAGIIAYAVIRHKVMDFNLLVRWGLAYGMLLGILAITFCLIAYIFQYLFRKFFQVNGLGIVFSLSCTIVVFDIFKRHMKKFVDQFIFRSPDLSIVLNDIEETMLKSTNTLEFTNNLSEKLKQIWHTNHVGLILWNQNKAAFDFLPKNEFRDYIVGKMTENITNSDFLVKTLESERRLFLYGIVTEDEISKLGENASPGQRTTFWKIRRTMRWLGASVCVPLMMDKQLIGFLALGKKVTGEYNNEDKKFLSHIGEVIAQMTSIRIFGPKLINIQAGG